MQLLLGVSAEAERPKLNGKPHDKTESSEVVQKQKCFKCGIVKPLSDFYKHPQMANGHLGKCKECNKRDVRQNYRLRRDQYRNYYKQRESTEHRKASRKQRQSFRRINRPEKYKAQLITSNAIRSGKLTRQPCEKCGNPRSEAHHDDYSKPLAVRWLCFKHHREHHGQTVT